MNIEFKDIKQLAKSNPVSVYIAHCLVVSLHSALMFSKNSNIFIETVKSNIPFDGNIQKIIMITCVLFSVFCYADTYTFYLMYLNYEESLLGDKGDPTLEIKYKKTLRKKEIFSGYVGVFAYLITLLEFYELKYLVFYLGLYYSHKFVYVISPLSAKVYKRISNPNFLDVYYVLGFVLSIFLIILKLYKS